MRNVFFFALTLILMCSSLNAMRDEINLKLQQATTSEEQVEILKEYFNKTDDVDLLRLLQDFWSDIDETSCDEYFTAKFKANPKSEIFHYLWARNIKDDLKQQEEGRKIVKKYPNFHYGYLLVAYLYNGYLFRDIQHPDIDNKLLEKLYKKDEKLLKRWNKKFPKEEQVHYTMFLMNMWKKDYQQAEKYLLMGTEELPDWTNHLLIMDFCSRTSSTKVFQELFPQIISKSIAQGAVPRADSLYMYSGFYFRLLYDIKKWEELDSYLEVYPELLEHHNIQKVLVDIYFDREMYDRSISLLNTLYDDGRITYASILSQKEWAAMDDIADWQELKNKAKEQWEAESPERQKKALANKQNRVAPLWELPDKNDNIVKLEDCKGSIVILDFWATWCGPCQLVMPILDGWMREEMPAGVEVFSILVWEESKENASNLFETKNYKMTLLIGDNELSETYGFRGIPHLVIIDKEGIIRYTESGASENLAEKLTWWVEDLMEE